MNATTVRLDIWLNIACLYKTRSEAQRACQGGKVEVNGQRSKPHRQLTVGDRIELSRPYGRKQTLSVAGLAERHMRKADVKALYNDTTPPLSAEEQALRSAVQFCPSPPLHSIERPSLVLRRLLSLARALGIESLAPSKVSQKSERTDGQA